MRVTTVLWDIDGTLLRSGGVAAQAFLDAVAEVTGVRPTPERRDYGGRLDTEIAEQRLRTCCLRPWGATTTHIADVLEALQRLVAERLGELRAQTSTHPGVDALLATLATAGVRRRPLATAGDRRRPQASARPS
jgi:phosphoglycolate phosphatase